MRPIRLTVEGFTAFRTEQVLDFEHLDLFAIVGPTGAGKSSLLDALTYALYGDIARVQGSQTSIKELVSQGLPWMKVMLDFQVGRERYRVTRRTPSGAGAAKILLERLVGDEATTFGPGSDRIRDVNDAIEGLIGLDYDGFTRSVLLPQGKFADLLTGKPDQRRKLLTDLLDLRLFERMGERARRIAVDAERSATNDRAFVAERLAHATPESLDEAKALVVRAEAAEQDLAAARQQVDTLAVSWIAVSEEAKVADRAGSEADRLAGIARGVGVELDRLAAEADSVARVIASAETAERAARDAADAAAAALADAEKALGSRDGLLAALSVAELIPRSGATLTVEEDALADLVGGIEKLERVRLESDAAVEVAAAELTSAEATLVASQGRLEEVRHADLVADLVSDLQPGDPCPVCGSILASVPVGPGSEDQAEARASVEAAERARDIRREALDAARGAAEGARRDAADRATAVAEASARLERTRETHGELHRRIVEALGEPLPADPAEALRIRLTTLDEAVARCRDAGSAIGDASKAAAEAREAASTIRTETARLAGRLDIDAAPLAADRSVDGFPSPPTLPPSPGPGEISALIAHSGQVAAALETFAIVARDIAAKRRTVADRLTVDAKEAVAHLIPEGERFDDIQRAVAAMALDAREARVGASERLKKLTEDVSIRTQIESRIREGSRRSRTFSALSGDLRADHLIDFLQGEALRILCVAGSDHLTRLSAGRYRLAYEADEFAVIDAENGDERRSVRTLSGGETFLASLSLALALAGEVRSLSVSERAPLESLFLDEGFGTLDPETLETVAGAIEQLGGESRLVGIVTHVRELADRLPSRIQVVRAASGRGSSLVQDR